MRNEETKINRAKNDKTKNDESKKIEDRISVLNEQIEVVRYRLKFGNWGCDIRKLKNLDIEYLSLGNVTKEKIEKTLEALNFEKKTLVEKLEKIKFEQYTQLPRNYYNY